MNCSSYNKHSARPTYIRTEVLLNAVPDQYSYPSDIHVFPPVLSYPRVFNRVMQLRLFLDLSVGKCGSSYFCEDINKTNKPACKPSRICHILLDSCITSHHLNGAVVSMPCYESAGLNLISSLGSQLTGHPAVHPSLSGQLINRHLGKLNYGNLDDTLTFCPWVAGSYHHRLKG